MPRLVAHRNPAYEVLTRQYDQQKKRHVAATSQMSAVSRQSLSRNKETVRQARAFLQVSFLLCSAHEHARPFKSRGSRSARRRVQATRRRFRNFLGLETQTFPAVFAPPLGPAEWVASMSTSSGRDRRRQSLWRLRTLGPFVPSVACGRHREATANLFLHQGS